MDAARIWEIIEAGESLATCNAQNPDDAEDSELPTCVALLALEAFGDASAQRSTLFAVMHTVARQVFMYQHSAAVSMKLSAQEEPEEIDLFSEESEDALYRVCGAQVHRMITVRGEKASRNKQARTFLNKYPWQMMTKCIACHFLFSALSRGGRIFPKPELLPFIQLVVSKVKEEVNDAAFKRFGENLFKVCIVKINWHNDFNNYFM